MIKRIALALVLWPSAALAHVNDKCRALIEEAKVESSLLKSPAAIARLGTVDTTKQNVIAGVTYSFSDRYRGDLVDQRGLAQCRKVEANDELISYLRYVDVEKDQVRAAAENAFLRDKRASIDEQTGRLRTLLARNLITISEFEEYALVAEMIRSRIDQNEITLSHDNQFDHSLDLSAAINRLREATRMLSDISLKVRTSSGFDFAVQTGIRAPVDGSSAVNPFGALSVRYSFGKHASERSAKLATAYTTKAMSDDVDGVLYGIEHSMESYAEETELVERSNSNDLRSRRGISPDPTFNRGRQNWSGAACPSTGYGPKGLQRSDPKWPESASDFYESSIHRASARLLNSRQPWRRCLPVGVPVGQVVWQAECPFWVESGHYRSSGRNGWKTDV